MGAPGIRFRADIEGLRAIAVILVVFDHLEFRGFRGGYIGVDVFFVISGYLITALLVAEYTERASRQKGRGSISISAFYLRRARRILPAALAVIGAVWMASHFLLNSLRAQQVRHDAVWAALFGSNINFIRQARDYFTAGLVTSSPFNHYWSLAVEEQFYFIWPVLFLCAASLRGLKIWGWHVPWRLRIAVTLCVVGTVSLLWSVLDTSHNPTSAYFSTFTRAWELALGALIAVLAARTTVVDPRKATAASFVGIALLIVGCTVIGPESSFPGYIALLPTLGAACLIAGGLTANPPLPNRVLSVAPMRFVGRVSYSLYLWHWPLIVFTAALYPKAAGRLSTRFEILVLTCLIAVASFYLIERPFRKMHVGYESGRIDELLDRINVRALAFPASVVAGIAVLISVFVVAVQGQDSHTDAIRADLALATAGRTAAPGHARSAKRAATVNPQPEIQAKGESRRVIGYRSALVRWQRQVRKGLAVVDLPPRLQPLTKHLTWVPADPCQSYRLAIVDHEDVCSWGSSAARHIAVITGDSHASMWLTTLEGALDPERWRLHAFIRGWCGWATFSDDVARTPPENRDCPALQAQTRARLKTLDADLLILSEDGIRSQDDMVDALRRFQGLAKHVVVIGHTPHVPNFTLCLRGSSNIASCKGHLSARDYSDVALERHAASLFRASFVDTTPWFCIQLTCPPVIAQAPAFIDGGHITQEIAPKLVPLLRESLRAAHAI